MDNKPLKIRPDLVYAVICSEKPQHRFLTMDLIGILEEIRLRRVPDKKTVYLILGWQRGIGKFELDIHLTTEDGTVIGSQHEVVELEPIGSIFTIPLDLRFTEKSFGAWLIEGFLDKDSAFRTRLMVVRHPMLSG